METVDLPPFLANRVKIEQRLGGMLMRTITGVDYARLQSLREKLRRARRTVTQDEDVGVERFKILGRVFKRFAFRQAGSRYGNVDDVGAQAMSGEFEGGARARARLDKEIYQRLTAQCWHFLDLARADFFECVRRLENEIDFLGR